LRKPVMTGFFYNSIRSYPVFAGYRVHRSYHATVIAGHSRSQPSFTTHALSTVIAGHSRSKPSFAFQVLPLYCAPPAPAVDIVDCGDDSNDGERDCPLAGLHQELPEQPDGREMEDELWQRATVAEVALRMIDWMGDHKSTWASAEGIWTMLKSMLPVDAPLCVFSRVKAILVSHLDNRLRVIPVCPCGYTVYMNCTSKEFSGPMYQNAHRTRCPRPLCGLSKHLPGIVPAKARKV
jgi:hypothetical protein